MSKLSIGPTKQLIKDEDQEGKYLHQRMQNWGTFTGNTENYFVNIDTEYLHTYIYCFTEMFSSFPSSVFRVDSTLKSFIDPSPMLTPHYLYEKL